MTQETDDALRDLQRAVARAQDLLAAVERRTHRLLEERAQGREYAELATMEDRPLVVEMLSDVLEDLAAVGARFRRSEARVLHAGGMSQEAIGALFGVTRQRVAALLAQARADEAAPHSRRGART